MADGRTFFWYYNQNPRGYAPDQLREALLEWVYLTLPSAARRVGERTGPIGVMIKHCRFGGGMSDSIYLLHVSCRNMLSSSTTSYASAAPSTSCKQPPQPPLPRLHRQEGLSLDNAEQPVTLLSSDIEFTL
jgi:hypothetical protein